MRRGSQAVATALGVSAALMVLAGALAGGAAAEQATQPAAAAAGRLDLGKYHSCAVLPTGSVRCWGYGRDGALGYGNTTTIGDDETPAAAGPVSLGAGRTATAVGAGSVHTCAVLDSRAVRCWGFGGDGRLGYGSTQTIGDDEPPDSVGPVELGIGRTAKAITAGRAHTCAVLDNGSVRCWGFGFDGRLGYGNSENIGNDETPDSAGPVALGTGRTATAITAGDAHTCALLDDGTVRCWGNGGNGQVGYGNSDNIGDNETPDTVGPVKLGAGRTAVAIAAGDFHTCAVLDDGAVRCWGYGGNGRLGYPNRDSIGDNETPDAAGPVDLGPGRTAKAITAGADQTCALLDNGSVRCWGVGTTGALGYGNTATIGDDETPGSVGPVNLGAGRTAVAIAAGGDHTCALLDDGSLRCWGKGPNGELGSCSRNAIGDDETPGSAGPVDLGIPGSPSAGCAAAVTPTPTPTGEPTPTPIVEPPGETPTPTATADPYIAPEPDGLAAQAKRARALRACRSKVERQSAKERRRARRHTRRAKRLKALRRARRRAAAGQSRCLKRFGRTPGRVTTLAARAAGKEKIVVSFQAPGTDGSNPPAARGYLVKQSPRPIKSARDFKRAPALCKGTCRFKVVRLAAKIKLTVGDLRRGRTYYYAVAARDNVSARTGPRSKTVRAKTR